MDSQLIAIRDGEYEKAIQLSEGRVIGSGRELRIRGVCFRSMTRPLRLEFPNALYHVTSRGDRREDIY